MVAIRLRHPQGVATIQVALDRDDFTVQDLQQEIFASTNILPSRQSLKAGYPPHPLTLIPELPLASLGLKTGEQIIVSELPDKSPATRAPTASSIPSRASTLSSGSFAAPAPVSPSVLSPSQSSGPDYVETDGGVLVHRVVPDDNSCLFSAVALVFEQSISKAPEMRQIVAEGIRKEPETYNEAILGMPPSQYINTILKPSTWGGAIELGILASHFRTEIASIDVETGRIDHFSPPADQAGGMRCILIYSGIHYDAATLAPMVDAPGEWHQTVFPVQSSGTSAEEDSVLVAAKKLADILRAKKAFTNTATFDLKCEVCGQGLKGEKDARAHAEQTGHVRFGEY
ncbi:putative ubiquitin thioesterase otu1 [Hypsizygus marmoreus]|uniref:Ubiquitin thioesterase OTU n=1 Tax=Hypsizygus marmoreus TaxID=39966 RepID=A0A369JIX2_HYPMA|nr:putative ubiquitin thioesterase otu1 [Hypsizygus marmoreus]